MELAAVLLGEGGFASFKALRSVGRVFTMGRTSAMAILGGLSLEYTKGKAHG
jgi:hypothetical protein